MVSASYPEVLSCRIRGKQELTGVMEAPVAGSSVAGGGRGFGMVSTAGTAMHLVSGLFHSWSEPLAAITMVVQSLTALIPLWLHSCFVALSPGTFFWSAFPSSNIS